MNHDNRIISVIPSKEIVDSTRHRKKCLILAGIEPKTSGFDRPVLYRLSYEARRRQVVSDYGDNRSWSDVLLCNSVLAGKHG